VLRQAAKTLLLAGEESAEIAVSAVAGSAIFSSVADLDPDPTCQIIRDQDPNLTLDPDLSLQLVLDPDSRPLGPSYGSFSVKQ